jgi:hypothetical protein
MFSFVFAFMISVFANGSREFGTKFRNNFETLSFKTLMRSEQQQGGMVSEPSTNSLEDGSETIPPCC